MKVLFPIDRANGDDKRDEYCEALEASPTALADKMLKLIEERERDEVS